MKLILFDIDGTLLHTDGLSKDLFFESVSETFSVEINPGNIPWGGLTDKGIAEYALRDAGVREELIQARLPEAFHMLGEKWSARGSMEHFTVYSEAVELLQRLEEAEKIDVGVLTANCRQGAEHKLRIPELDHHFQFLVTGDLVSQRDNLPPFTFDQTLKHLGRNMAPQECVIIGDTPADISCAKANGMSVVAVATGRYSLDQLAHHQPDLLLPNLTPTDELLSFLS